jgi:hypothetical protein
VLIWKNKTSDNTREYQMYYNATENNLYFVLSTAGTTGVGKTFSFTPTAGTWYYIVFVFDNGTGRVYINGSEIGTGKAFGFTTTYNSANPLQIGAGASGANASDAVFDEFGFWSRALSGAEVTELYNNGNGITYPFASTFTPHIVWWQ